MSTQPLESDTRPASADGGNDLERLVQAITGIESIVSTWDGQHALTVQALKSAIEALSGSSLSSCEMASCFDRMN